MRRLARIGFIHITSAAAAAMVFPFMAAAQQAQPQAQQQSGEWEKMPRMQLDRQFAGPLQDTIVQRWRDSADGTICYIYLPITVAHSPPTPSGFVQYGANTIGSISCVNPTPAAAPKRSAPPPAPATAPAGERK